jgi:hypothetical protein
MPGFVNCNLFANRCQVHFQVMDGGTFGADDIDTLSGEIEIEKLQIHNIESRSKNLIPVFDSLHTSRFQPTRYAQNLEA